jgi:hypothetical protein
MSTICPYCKYEIEYNKDDIISIEDERSDGVLRIIDSIDCPFCYENIPEYDWD